jgi:hypothetical protein
MLRVFVCVAVLMSGCAIDPSPDPLRVKTEKIAVACPSDDQIRAIAVEASRTTYLNPSRPKAGGSGSCPCRRDTYKTSDGVEHSCAGMSAEDRNDWVMCTPQKVPKEVVEKVKLSLPAECRR